ATTPPGPLFLAMSWDVQVAVIGVTGLNGPAFWNMSMTLGDAMPDSSGGGLDMFVDPNLPAKTMLLGSKAAATSYGGPAAAGRGGGGRRGPARLRHRRLFLRRPGDHLPGRVRQTHRRHPAARRRRRRFE